MSTMEFLSIGYRAARDAARQRRGARSGVARRSRVTAITMEHGLTILAGGCFTVAAAMVAVPLGLVVAGVALLVLELRAAER